MHQEERSQKRASSADFTRHPGRYYKGFDSSKNNRSNELRDLVQTQVAAPKDLLPIDKARTGFYPRGFSHTGNYRSSEAVQNLIKEDEVEAAVRPQYVPRPVEVIAFPPALKSRDIVHPDCWTYGCPSGYQHTGGNARDVFLKQRVLHEGGTQFGSPGGYGHGSGWWTTGTPPSIQEAARSASASAFHRKGCDGPLNNRSDGVSAVAFGQTQSPTQRRKVGGNGIHGPVTKWGSAMLSHAVPDMSYGAYHYP